ncbi:toll/interleukin-1 receptor domain-containing protein [Streptomyces scabiei]|uniref:toll/interleukin-1 receptor domain-containing protein n=1 Tax=Streptomyces scabiei TaxID=1930 RepID=UPI000A3B58D7|nr:toll/interleukin-1 receptor domain-containing protein [Streptomyces scabiei]
MAQVFISHRGSDNDAAERLATELRTHGHQVWIDLWEISLGDSIVAKIDDGLAISSYLVLCYSSDGIHAPWMSQEWMSTLARQLNGQKVKILPVRLSGGSPPAILADVKYADLAADWPSGITALRKELK